MPIEKKIFVTLSKSNEMAYGYKEDTYDFDQLHDVIADGNYSPFVFKDNYRSLKNYLPGKTNTVIFDFDSGVLMETAFNIFSGYTYFCVTTKSHQLLKNGIRADRFRIILPLDAPVTCDAELFQKTMKKLAWSVGSDTNTCDAARMYHGHPGKFYYAYGKLFSFAPWITRPVNCDDVDLRKRVVTRVPRSFFNESSFVLNPANWEIAFKPREILPGGRNSALARIALWLRDAGASPQVLASAVSWVNDNMPTPLPDKEIDLLIRGKIR